MTRRMRSRQSTSRLTVFLICGLLGLALLGAQQAPRSKPVTATPTAAEAKSHPMDEPLRLLRLAQKKFAGITDYSCVMVKSERLRGQMQRHIIELKVRNKPFSVFMSWQHPKDLIGQQACYVEGRNKGNMRVIAPSGVLRALGWVSLKPDGPRAKKNSNHSITEAGIGNLLKSFDKAYGDDRKYNKTKVRIGEYLFAKRRVTRVETVRMVKIQGVFTDHRDVLYFDRETSLPIRVERYGWPTKENPKGELFEEYNYLKLKTNVGLPDETFQH